MVYFLIFLSVILFIRSMVCFARSLNPKYDFDASFNLICQAVCCLLLMLPLVWIGAVWNNF